MRASHQARYSARARTTEARAELAQGLLGLVVVTESLLPRKATGHQVLQRLGVEGICERASDKGTAGLTHSCLAHSDVVWREIDIGKHMGSRRTAFSSDPVR